MSKKQMKEIGPEKVLNGARLAEGGGGGLKLFGNAYMGENACPDVLEYFFPCPNGQFRVLRGGQNTLPGWFVYCLAEIDISVSKLLGFETFAIFLGFWFRFRRIWSQKKVSVSENLVLEKSLGFGLGEFGLRKKVLVSVLENLVSEKKYRFWFWRIWSQKKSIGFGFGKFGLGKKAFVSENLVSETKSRYRFRSKFWL